MVALCLPKGRDGIGKSKRGKGTKVMLIADGNGLPIGLCLASVHHHEAKLAVICEGLTAKDQPDYKEGTFG
jgi:hypothetical protein